MRQIEKQNPDVDIINVQDPDDENQTYLHKLVYTELIHYVAYFLEKNANIYVLDSNKLNPLHSIIGRVYYCIKYAEYEHKIVTYQILGLLLNYEAEQRAYFPEKCQDLSWLKDQLDYQGHTPLTHTEKLDESPGKEVVQELKKAFQEQEAYYQACLEAKPKGILLIPYHKQFLSNIIKKTELEQEQKEKTWSEKISESPNFSLRHRSKSDEPLQTKQEAAEANS